MRIGIIGAGLQARRRIPPLLEDKRNQIVIISSKTGKTAVELGKKYRIKSAVGFEAVTSRKDLDAVLVLTPPDVHAKATIMALKNGAHVLCEKPLARTLKEAEEMVKVTKKTGKILKCGFNHRHHPGIQQAKKWIDQGQLGTPIFGRGRYGIIGRPGLEKEWRSDPTKISGGQLMEQGIHLIDLFRWLTGEIKEVVAFTSTKYWKIKMEDNAFAILKTQDNFLASVHSSTTQWKNLFSFEIFGSKGYIQVEGLGGSYGDERAVFGRLDFKGPFAEEIIEFRNQDSSWKEEWEEFIKAMRTGREPFGNGKDGLEAMRAVIAAYQSAQEGKAVTISSVKSSYDPSHYWL